MIQLIQADMEAEMFNYKIAEARIAKGWSQAELAKKIGTTQQQIARYESGENDVKSSVILKLSSALGVTVTYLLGMEDAISFIKPKPSSGLALPVVGRIAAGTPREAIAQSGETHEVPDTIYYEHEHAFFLVVAGNSMNRLFPEGALVLVDPDEEVRNGDVAVVFVNGDDATLKRVYFDGDSVRLVPESFDPEYRERVIDRSDPDAPLVRIVGKAVSYTAPDGWRA